MKILERSAPHETDYKIITVSRVAISRKAYSYMSSESVTPLWCSKRFITYENNTEGFCCELERVCEIIYQGNHEDLNSQELVSRLEA